jgi:hypothetical protein
MFWDYVGEAAAFPYHKTREWDKWLKITTAIGRVLLVATRLTLLVLTRVKL